jgi:hypothetical protein
MPKFRAIMWKLDLLVHERMTAGMQKETAVKAASEALVALYKTSDKTLLYQHCNNERKAALAAGGGGGPAEGGGSGGGSAQQGADE